MKYEQNIIKSLLQPPLYTSNPTFSVLGHILLLTALLYISCTTFLFGSPFLS